MPERAAAYCPDCGTETTTEPFEDRDRRYCPACEAFLWRHAVPTTSVTVLDGDRVLLVERGHGRHEGLYALPAGHPEYDEPARVGAARELAEETGLSVDPAVLELVGTVLSEGEEAFYRSLNYRVDRAATTGSPEGGSDANAAAFVPLERVRSLGEDLRPLARRRLESAGVLG